MDGLHRADIKGGKHIDQFAGAAGFHIGVTELVSFLLTDAGYLLDPCRITV